MVFFYSNCFTMEDLEATGMFASFPTEDDGAWSSPKEAPCAESPWNAEKLNAEAERERREQEADENHWSSPILAQKFASTWDTYAQHDVNNEQFADHQAYDSHHNNQYKSADWNSRVYQESDATNSTYPRSPYAEDYEEESNPSTCAGDDEYDNFAGADFNSYKKQNFGTNSFDTQDSGGSPSNTFSFAPGLTDEDLEELDFENLFMSNDADDTKKPKTKTKQPTSAPSSIDLFIDRYVSISREKSRLLSPKKHRNVTKSDIVRWKLPRSTTGTYWDPDEAPIVLLSDTFDAFSLGRWIYDWAEVCEGHESEIARTAEDLWSLLVNLAKKVKQAKAALKLIKGKCDLETVRGFVEGAGRLMARFQKVLKRAENHMWHPDCKVCRQCKQLGQKAGIDFVNAFFTDEDLSARVKSCMSGMDVWNFRYDVNCKETVDYFFR